MLKIGHRYIVKIHISSKRWFPDQGKTAEEAHEWTTEESYDMICSEMGLTACNEMLEALIIQDFGKQGVTNGEGVEWHYSVDSVKYEGEVRL